VSAKDNPKINEEKILNDIYNLLLDTNTLEQERNILLSCKKDIEKGVYLLTCITQLVTELRPLAIKRKLSTNVSEFYVEVSNYKALDKELGRGLIFFRM
jgi:peptide-methionine (S)-S-oxide reductase